MDTLSPINLYDTITFLFPGSDDSNLELIYSSDTSSPSILPINVGFPIIDTVFVVSYSLSLAVIPDIVRVFGIIFAVTL